MDCKGYDPEDPDIQNKQSTNHILKKISIILGVCPAIYMISTILLKQIQIKTKFNLNQPELLDRSGQLSNPPILIIHQVLTARRKVS